MSNQVTISDLKRSLIIVLSSFQDENEARSIANIILDHLGYSTDVILKNPTLLTNNKIQAEIKKIVGQLQENKPIQYIIGETYFYDRIFKLNEHVLIPRPETEELTDIIIKENDIEQAVILDIGTGSGCIAVTLAANIENSMVLAMDVDLNCLEVAKENSDLNNTSVLFINGNILKCKSLSGFSWIDIIVSNPPYVTEKDKELMHSKVLDYEPEKALFVPSDDPLIFFRKIIQFASNNLSEEGVIYVEINENFGPETLQLFKDNGFTNAELRKDFHGKDRFIKASR